MEKKISKFIIKLCEENALSHVNGSMAVKKARSFLKENGISPDDIQSAFLHPKQSFGSFDELPKIFRESLSHSAHFHIQEMNLLTSSFVRILAYGYISRMGGYLVHQGWKLKDSRLGWMHSFFILLGRRVIRACRDLSRAILRLFRFSRFYRAPFIHMLWEYVKVDPWPLIQGYIKNIPIDPRLSTVFKYAQGGTISCGLVGIDFLPSRGALHFLESNFNPGHYIDRHKLFPDGDTLCNHLVDWAAENGYSKIIFFPHNFQALFEKNLEDAWHKIAQKKGIGLEIVDDRTIGSPWARSRRTLMDCKLPGVLYVNGRHLPGPLSNLIAEKGLLDKEIKRFNDSVQNGAKIAIPRVFLNDQDVPQVDNDAVFPNIIIKNARLDQTKGISLYKSKSLPDGANTWPNIAYEYIVPDMEVKEEHGRILKYAYIFRAYLLITPDGPVYVGARKDVSSVPIPNALPFGMIDDKSPYITNLYVAAYSVPHSAAEDKACRDAILSIGKLVFSFLREKHILTVE